MPRWPKKEAQPESLLSSSEPKTPKSKTPESQHTLFPNGSNGTSKNRDASSEKSTTTHTTMAPGSDAPPEPKTVTAEEAARANEQRDEARNDPKRRGRPPGSRNAKASKRPVVVIERRMPLYVDEDGTPIPDFTGADLKPMWFTVGKFLEKSRGWEPLSEDELVQLSNGWAPVAQKWGGFLLGWLPEIGALMATAAVFWGRIDEENRREAKDNKTITIEGNRVVGVQ